MLDLTMTENLRFRVSESLKQRWTETCSARKISQQDAINALMEWFVNQQELTQLMITGQVTASKDLIETVLKRLLHVDKRPVDKSQIEPLDKIADRHGKVKREPTPKEAAKN